MEVFNVGEEAFFSVVGECHRACAGEGAFAFFHQFEDGVLDHFGVHHERRQFLAFAQIVEHGVGHIAHSRLQRQEFFGETAVDIFADEETDNV